MLLRYKRDPQEVEIGEWKHAYAGSARHYRWATQMWLASALNTLKLHTSEIPIPKRQHWRKGWFIYKNSSGLTVSATEGLVGESAAKVRKTFTWLLKQQDRAAFNQYEWKGVALI